LSYRLRSSRRKCWKLRERFRGQQGGNRGTADGHTDRPPAFDSGVDVITSGVQSTNVVVRGFNNIFSGALHTLTDYRVAGVPSLRVNFMHFIPQTDDDISRMEVVLGPGSALYGPNTANGVLHILTKSPLDEPGTSISLAGGERSLFHGSFRTAQRVSDKFGFKVSGQWGVRWLFPDSGDESITDALPTSPALFPTQ
jgi:iron complex outermembrane receptor protein